MEEVDNVKMGLLMNTKSIALSITFAAVAIALNAVRIPAVFYPGNFYQISQIPIVVAFLLFGARIGVSVGVLTLMGQLTLFPVGASGFVAYPMDLLSSLIMFGGLYAASRSMKANDESERFPVWKKPIIILTALAVAFRGVIMPLIDYFVTFHVLIPLFSGISRPEAVILGLVPAFVLYNLTVPLYTVPIAYVLATRVGRYLRIEPRLLRQA